MLRTAYKSKIDIENSLIVPKGSTHFLFQMLVQNKNLLDKNKNMYTISTVSFLDLASFDKEMVNQLNLNDSLNRIN